MSAPVVPAFVFAGPGAPGPKVAAVSVLDRLVVCLHRAGFAPVTLVGEANPKTLKRARARKIPFEISPAVPPVSGKRLVADGAVLSNATDLEAVRGAQARLATAEGDPLPLGVTDRPVRSAQDIEAALAGVPIHKARGPAALVLGAAEAAEASRRLWASLGSSADGPMDRFVNRPLGRFLSKLLVHTPVTPNQITICAMLIGVAAAYLFSLGTPQGFLWGALAFQLSAVVDCVDGDIARALYKETPVGKWLDIGADQVVHLSLFACIAVGLARAGTDAPVFALGGSAAAGALLSFLVVLRGMLQPQDRRNPKLARLIDTATNRDFSYLILALVIAGKLEIFLWLAAFGAHLFWIAALTIQLAGESEAEAARP